MAQNALQAVPARPRYEPPEPPILIDLRGTTWQGKDLTVANRVYVFESDGTLHYGKNNPSSLKGSWKLDGNEVYFEMNNRFREFKGIIQGDTMTGESWNKSGKRWQTTFHRVRDMK
jgi:hypothetical protein